MQALGEEEDHGQDEGQQRNDVEPQRMAHEKGMSFLMRKRFHGGFPLFAGGDARVSDRPMATLWPGFFLATIDQIDQGRGDDDRREDRSHDAQAMDHGEAAPGQSQDDSARPAMRVVILESRMVPKARS